jgi:hypothetical protein
MEMSSSITLQPLYPLEKARDNYFIEVLVNYSNGRNTLMKEGISAGSRNQTLKR